MFRTFPARPALIAASILAGACGHGVTPSPISPTPPREHAASSVRRVCLQAGLGAPGTGGGSIVFVTGEEAGGVGLDTLSGAHFTASSAALCRITPQSMRVCPASADRAGPVTTAVALNAAPTSAIARGDRVRLLEYVVDKGTTKALVDVDGQARLVLADEICHAQAPPAQSKATSFFAMNTSAPAGPRAFRPRDVNAIQRIVIHNTEVPLDETLHHFGRVEANTSAHVVIDRDGTVYRVVEDAFAAFHAGSSKDSLGGFNTTSLGIEVVAYTEPRYHGEPGDTGTFAEAQRIKVIELVDFWMEEYGLDIAPTILSNRASDNGYADLEYSRAAVTIHRLTKADRGTSCPRLLFNDTPEGDEDFFRWRETTFSAAARRARAAPPTIGVSLTSAHEPSSAPTR